MVRHWRLDPYVVKLWALYFAYLLRLAYLIFWALAFILYDLWLKLLSFLGMICVNDLDLLLLSLLSPGLSLLLYLALLSLGLAEPLNWLELAILGFVLKR